jgi:hypothetical protein
MTSPPPPSPPKPQCPYLTSHRVFSSPLLPPFAHPDQPYLPPVPDSKPSDPAAIPTGSPPLPPASPGDAKRTRDPEGCLTHARGARNGCTTDTPPTHEKRARAGTRRRVMDISLLMTGEEVWLCVSTSTCAPRGENPSACRRGGAWLLCLLLLAGSSTWRVRPRCPRPVPALLGLAAA